ncbi:unnamed protein product [Parnassius mnemosyne]|uniref:Uncharacterized protein n=1 Tax=Parnassius mnemosyne TaxID=213953 RepID=A0AAV1KL65_9NEOP
MSNSVSISQIESSSTSEKKKHRRARYTNKTRKKQLKNAIITYQQNNIDSHRSAVANYQHSNLEIHRAAVFRHERNNPGI